MGSAPTSLAEHPDADVFVIAMNDAGPRHAYPSRVRFEIAERAFNWFLGENHLQQWLFDPSTGDCRDGLHIDRVNQNQGTRKGIPRSCEASKARAINLYYGAADTSVALATGSISQLLDWLDRHGTPCNHAIGSYPLGPAILFRGSVCPAVL